MQYPFVFVLKVLPAYAGNTFLQAAMGEKAAGEGAAGTSERE